MTALWPIVPLSKVVCQRKQFITISDVESYKRCRVQLHAQGIVLRDVVVGAEIKTKQQQVCRAGEFLVAEIDAKVGGFGIVPESLDGAIVSSHYFLFEVNNRLLDRQFLNYYVRTHHFRDQVVAKGSTNYAAVRPADVLSYQVPLPPLNEQRRIVARIEELAAKIEEARGLRRQAGEEAKLLTTASARQLLAQVDAPTTELRHWLNQERGGIQTGPFGAQLSSSDFTDSGMPILTIGNVQFNGLKLDNLKHVTPEKASQLARYKLKKGDILFARMGTIGRCCLVPEEAEGWLINYHIIRVALSTGVVEPRYMFWVLRASTDVETYLAEKIRGATREGVNSAIVGGLPCRVPDLEEQRRIVSYLDGLETKLDALKHAQAETAAELDALLPSVLDKAFSGEL